MTTDPQGGNEMEFEARTQTNPRAKSDPPYALRYSANRPEGRFATIEEAVAAAKAPDAAIVTADGWWIVGRVVEKVAR